MTPEETEKPGEVFLAARRLPVDQRDTYLAEICGDDTTLLVEVRSLLAADGLDTLRSRRQAFDPNAIPSSTESRHGFVGERTGRYAIRSAIMSGTMGTVYVAFQEDPRPASLQRECKRAGTQGPVTLRG